MTDLDKADLVKAAAEVLAAYESRVPIAPLRGRLVPEGDVDAAYAVQRAQARRWEAAGRRQVGAKIGLTSKAVQNAFGVYQPDFGVLYADMAVLDGEPIPAGRLLQPRVEAEVAFVLGRDLPYEQVTVVDVIRATDHLLPAIEVVDSRIAGWDISIVDTVADNASSGLFVLGNRPARLADVDLRLCGAVLTHEGELVSVGAGAACLGNPVHAVAWLAQTQARAGSPLKAGDLVLSGALGPMVPLPPPVVTAPMLGGAPSSTENVNRGPFLSYEARISGLGSVRAVFQGSAP